MKNKVIENVIYKSIIGHCEEMESQYVYRGNGHHFAQRLTTFISVGLLPKEKKKIYDVLTDIPQLTKEIALALRMPYSTQRWIGGTLTNFGEIKKRIEKLQDLLSKKEKGELSVYTKKERLLIDRSIEKMDNSFGGLSEMKQLPAALFVVDSLSVDTAVKEANFMHIPVISISNTDCNLKMIDYPIVANDNSQASLKFLLDEITKTLKVTQAPEVK